MGAPAIEWFLTDLAVNARVSASTQQQAFHALRCLDKQIPTSNFRASTPSALAGPNACLPFCRSRRCASSSTPCWAAAIA
jgi:hypothetical protein